MRSREAEALAGQGYTRAEYEALTYPRVNLKDFTLGCNSLDRTCPLDNGQHRREPEHGLGLLERLPLELVDDILYKLDLRTLTDFRRVNARAMVPKSLARVPSLYSRRLKR